MSEWYFLDLDVELSGLTKCHKLTKFSQKWVIQVKIVKKFFYLFITVCQLWWFGEKLVL